MFKPRFEFFWMQAWCAPSSVVVFDSSSSSFGGLIVMTSLADKNVPTITLRRYNLSQVNQLPWCSLDKCCCSWQHFFRQSCFCRQKRRRQPSMKRSIKKKSVRIILTSTVITLYWQETVKAMPTMGMWSEMYFVKSVADDARLSTTQSERTNLATPLPSKKSRPAFSIAIQKWVIGLECMLIQMIPPNWELLWRGIGLVAIKKTSVGRAWELSPFPGYHLESTGCWWHDMSKAARASKVQSLAMQKVNPLKWFEEIPVQRGDGQRSKTTIFEDPKAFS